MSKQIRNLQDEIMAIVEEQEGQADSRFRNWAKMVTGIDTKQSNGYCFEGDFVKDGTVEVEIKPAVFLTKTSRGSRRYPTATYNVLTMNAEGDLALTDIRTTDKTRGWALRIREQVADLVAEQQEEDAAESGLAVAAQRMQEAQEHDRISRREHDLMMLGYNQALLDHADLPLRHGDERLTRESVEKIVARLREELGK